MKAQKGKGRQAVAYLRVSTREQGQSGLGLEAQKHAVDVFCSTHGYRVAAEYKDVESGKHNARPGAREGSRGNEGARRHPGNRQAGPVSRGTSSSSMR